MDTKQLAQKIERQQGTIEKWFQEKTKGVRLPITTSVDIRNAVFKIAVVDTNVFPSGFNNLCNNFTKNAAKQFQQEVQKQYPKTKRILIVPESFTRNIPYFLHIRALEKMVVLAGFEVKIGFLGEIFSTDPFSVTLPNQETLTLHPLQKNKDQLTLSTWKPDLVLLNNDCSDGIPGILDKIKQPILPSPELGWHNRSKKHHFEIYCALTNEFATLLETDHWRFCPITFCERNIDIQNVEDLKRVAARVDQILERTKEKYDQYGISEKPYAFVKSNAGTFGLGMTHVSSGEELLEMNRKEKKKLTSSKGGVRPSEFLIQEGVPTLDDLNGAPIEPVLYFIGGEPIGGFFRIHEGKDRLASLNAPGARYEALCFHKIEEHQPEDLHLHWKDHKDFFKIARWLGRIATLAVGLEEKSL